MANQQFHRWRSELPLIVVLLSLLLLIVVPILTQRSINEVRRHVTQEVDPARATIDELYVRLSLESAASRGYVFTGETHYAEAHQRARGLRKQAYTRLVPLAAKLGPETDSLVRLLGDQLRPADVLLDSLYGGRISREQYMVYFPRQQTRLYDVTGTIGKIQQSITRIALTDEEEVQRREEFSALITIVLAAMALISVLLVAQLSRGYRRLARRLETRARQQRRLTEIARKLGSAQTMDEVVNSVVEAALSTGRASGAYIERTEPDRDPHEVEVRAVAGVGTPKRGTRIPYHDSSCARLIESNQPIHIFDGSTEHEQLPTCLQPFCPQCSGLAVPLYSEETVMGALVLVRTHDQEHFSPDEASYVQILGDITSAAARRVLALEQEREAHTKVATILESITDAFFALDREWRFTHMNGEAERLMQRSRDELIGRVIWDVYPQVRGTIFDHEYHRAMEQQTTVHFETYYETRDAWLEVRAYPSAKGLSVFYRDITERIRTAEERERLLQSEQQARVEAERRREDLDRVTESRSRLMRGFSHDLKNPLGAADGYLQLLEQGIVDSLTEKQKKSIARVRASIRAALDLIEDLLALERAEAGELLIEHEPVDVRRTTIEVVEEFRAQAEAKGVKLMIESDAQLPALVSDTARIRQVIGNLLSNAVKYTERGAITVSISLVENGKAPRPGRWIAVSVRDSGPGIPREHQKLVFDEFRRLKTAGKQPGAGIGLAMSRSIARAMGGDITLESEPGEGSTFTFWHPVQQP